MSETKKLLRLDPWAAAIERKDQLEKEQAERTAAPSINLDSQKSRNLERRKSRNLETGETRNLESAKRKSREPGAAIKSRPEQVNIQPDAALLAEIKHFTIDNRISLREFFERASRRYLDEASRNLSDGVSSFLDHDDLMMSKTSDDIIMLYRDLTGNRWKRKDDIEGQRFNAADRRYIEIGMLNTLLNFKGRRINSFGYFVNEIEEALAVKLDSGTLDIMVERRRDQWAIKSGSKTKEEVDAKRKGNL